MDLLIVQTALKSSLHRETVVIGKDTDVLILLLRHMNPESSSVYLFNEGKNMKPGKLWNIQVIADKLSNDVCKRLFFHMPYSVVIQLHVFMEWVKVWV